MRINDQLEKEIQEHSAKILNCQRIIKKYSSNKPMDVDTRNANEANINMELLKELLENGNVVLKGDEIVVMWHGAKVVIKPEQSH